MVQGKRPLGIVGVRVLHEEVLGGFVREILCSIHSVSMTFFGLSIFLAWSYGCLVVTIQGWRIRIWRFFFLINDPGDKLHR